MRRNLGPRVQSVEMTNEPPLWAAAAKVSVTQDANFVLRFQRQAPGGSFHAPRANHRQRQCAECRDSTHADQNRVEAVTATGGMHDSASVAAIRLPRVIACGEMPQTIAQCVDFLPLFVSMTTF